MAKAPKKARTKSAAKKPAKGKKTSPKATAAKASDVERVIGAGAFKELVSNILGEEADKNEAVGNIGSLVKAAVDKYHLDKKAFGIFRTLRRMSDKHLARTLSHLEHYLEVGGLNDRAKKQGQLFEEVAGGVTAAADQGDGDGEGEEGEAEEQTSAPPTNGGSRRAGFAKRAEEHGQAIKDAVAANDKTLAEKAAETPPTDAKH